MREEFDSLGKVLVPSDKLWGAQTERSRNNFRIGASGSMPIEIIHSYAILKKAAAITNNSCGILHLPKFALSASIQILENGLCLHFSSSSAN